MRMMAAHTDHDAPKVPDYDGPDLSFLAHSPPSEDSTIAFSREVIDEFMRTRAMEDEMDAMLARVVQLFVFLCRLTNCDAGTSSEFCGKSKPDPKPSPGANSEPEPEPGPDPNPRPRPESESS